MDDRERRRYDMFVRVKQFGIENAADFPAGSVGANTFAANSDKIDTIDSLSGDQFSGFSDARFSFANKGSIREDIREMISDINRTARSMVYQFPNIDEKFRMSRGNNDQQLLAKARSFHTEATPYETDFIAYGMDVEFLKDLNDEIIAFENALAEVGSSIDSHVEATAQIDVAVRENMQNLRILDGVVKNIYRNNVGKLAAWASASHIEKAPKRETPPPMPA